jgi:hypothetical protein
VTPYSPKIRAQYRERGAWQRDVAANLGLALGFLLAVF